MVAMTIDAPADPQGREVERPPHVLGRGTHGLAPAALKYENIRTLILAAILTPLAVAACFQIPSPGWRIAAFVALGVLTLATFAIDIPFVNRWEFQNTTYTVTRDTVFIRRGLLLRRTTTISTAQILNVEIAQGPLLRAFGLVKVKFACIADVESLTGLTPQAAETIRDTVLDSQGEVADD